MRRLVAVLALAALAGGTWATSAPAQDDGVYFDDPDSPGGKEYTIPHEQVRRENGAPGADGTGGGGGSQGDARFGVGIEPDGGGSAGGGSSGAAGEDASGGNGSGGNGSGGTPSGDGSGGAGTGDGGSGSGSTQADTGDVEYQATSASDTQPEVTVSAIALGVLLAGGGLGLLLRRTRRDATD